MEITKVYVKDFNPVLLSEEMQEAFGRHSISYIGFHRVSQYLFSPNAERLPYGRKEEGGRVIVLYADPGELKIHLEGDPGQTLDDLLTAHDAAVKSTPEVDKEEQDRDRALVVSALRSGNVLTDNVISAIARLVLKA